LFVPPYIENNKWRYVMGKLKFFWIVNVMAMLVFAAAVSGAGKVEITTAPGYTFAGYTEQKTTGDTNGYAGMNAICHDEFGEKARMCTTKEWFNTKVTVPNRQEPLSAWLKPTPVATVFNPSQGETLYIDWIGAELILTGFGGYPLSATCEGWYTTDIGTSGFVVIEGSPTPASSHVTTLSCSSNIHVTCCAPAK
jgi:hypothetical protein